VIGDGMNIEAGVTQRRAKLLLEHALDREEQLERSTGHEGQIVKGRVAGERWGVAMQSRHSGHRWRL
jgi:hypothetical protein